MRFRMAAVASILIALAGLLALPVLAQPPDQPDASGGRPDRPARERILRAFDKDGDGRLNDEEREAVREQMGERFEELRQRMGRDLSEERGPDEDGDRRPAGRRARERRPDEARDRERRADADRRQVRRPGDDGDRRRADRRRPGGPRGPLGGPPGRNLYGLFGWFDVDSDNMLSRREFAELTQFVERRRPRRPDSAAGPRFGRRGSNTPRPSGDDFRRRGPSRGFDRPAPDEGRPRREPQRDQRRLLREDPPRPPRPDRQPDPPSSPDRRPAPDGSN